MIRLYVDDVREAPEGWVLARTVAEAKRILETGDVFSVSLDHDMGACDSCTVVPDGSFRNCRHVEDGYALVLWMIEHDRVPALVHVHSMNPVGKRRMIAALEARRR